MGDAKPVLGKRRLRMLKTLAYPRYGADALSFVLGAGACGYGFGVVLSKAAITGVEGNCCSLLVGYTL